MNIKECSRPLVAFTSAPSSSTIASKEKLKGFKPHFVSGHCRRRVILSASANPLLRRITSQAPAPFVSQRGAPKNEEVEVSLADMWRQVQGSDHWNDMLDPIHPLLRSEIIRYGEFVKACYEAFEFDSDSKYYGGCKYGRGRLLAELDMADCGYEVTRYIYATPDISQLPDMLKQEGNKCNWIGFVAVAQREEMIRRLGRRDICVALRGTVTLTEWVANLMHILTPARLDPQNPRQDVKVELGFLSLYTANDTMTSPFHNHGSAREQLLFEIGRLVRKYEGEDLSITVTGHSMGGALALLCAYDVAELGLNSRNCVGGDPDIPITVYSFAGPRVGNAAFKQRCEELDIRILRIVHVHDPITKLPGVIFNENFQVFQNWVERYSHVGVELALDHSHSTSFFTSKIMQSCPSCIHQLGTYLELIECSHSMALSAEADARFAFLIKALNFLVKPIILSLLRVRTTLTPNDHSRFSEPSPTANFNASVRQDAYILLKIWKQLLEA